VRPRGRSAGHLWGLLPLWPVLLPALLRLLPSMLLKAVDVARQVAGRATEATSPKDDLQNVHTRAKAKHDWTSVHRKHHLADDARLNSCQTTLILEKGGKYGEMMCNAL